MPQLSTYHNSIEYTVTEISQALQHIVEERYGYIRVRGEISGSKRAPSGHMYLNLKDEVSVLACVCWRDTVKGLACVPEDGLEVVVSGRMTTYAGQSKYQLIIDQVTPSGIGALMALLEKRKKQFMEEGLFDPAHKKPLPFFPKVIGVVTSPTGAVIQDILHRIEARFPTHVILWPVLVQGQQAARQIAAAIDGFNQASLKPDVLIVARGGGSLEDLWPFNEEEVVRAAARSLIPLVSAVGHETDTTLIDYVADKRAPTPTAAAEMVTPVRSELVRLLTDYQMRQLAGYERVIAEKWEQLAGRMRGLSTPRRLWEEKMQRLDDLIGRMERALPTLLSAKMQQWQIQAVGLKRPTELVERQNIQLQHLLQRQEQAYERIIEKSKQLLTLGATLLESYHYKQTLRRGFVLVKHGNTVMSSSKTIDKGMALTLEFYDGEHQAVAL